MTQENKELLLKDLCVRLPYRVKGDAKGKIVFIMNTPIEREPEILTNIDIHTNTYGVSYQKGIPLYSRKGEINFKPYLFPLSSITERQKIELTCIIDSDYAQIDWYNKNHIDYRGLISKGLAIDATGLNIY